MASYSSILAWRIPWTGDPGRLQSMGSQESHKTASTIRCYLCEIANAPSFLVRVCDFHPISPGPCTLSCLAVLQTFDTSILSSHPQTFSFPYQEIQLLPQLGWWFSHCFCPSSSLAAFRSSGPLRVIGRHHRLHYIF